MNNAAKILTTEKREALKATVEALSNRGEKLLDASSAIDALLAALAHAENELARAEHEKNTQIMRADDNEQNARQFAKLAEDRWIKIGALFNNLQIAQAELVALREENAKLKEQFALPQ